MVLSRHSVKLLNRHLLRRHVMLLQKLLEFLEQSALQPPLDKKGLNFLAAVYRFHDCPYAEDHLVGFAGFPFLVSLLHVCLYLPSTAYLWQIWAGWMYNFSSNTTHTY